MRSDRLRTVGILGVEEGTSHINGQWGAHMNPLEGQVRRTGMIMTHVWDKKREVAEAFSRHFGVPNVVDRPEQMVGKVEAVIQSGYKASFWSVELVRPFLEAGAAALIDRPGAYSMKGARELIAAARKGRGVVYWGNNHEGHNATESLAWRSQALAPIHGILADSLADPEPRFYSMHCLHGVYMLCTLINGMVRRVRTFVASEDVFAPTTIFECENRDGSPFYATLARHGVDNVRHDNLKPLPHAREGAAHRGYLKVYGRGDAIEETLQPPLTYRRTKGSDVSPGPVPGQFFDGHGSPPVNHAAQFTLPAVLKLASMLETRKSPQSEEQLLGKLRVFLASWKSLLEGGRVQDVATLPEDWTGPNPYPEYLRGYFNA
jgi:hypothetical protein